MKSLYLLYITSKDDGNVTFSSPYFSFNEAKNNLETFLNFYASTLGKKILFLSKDDMKKLKLNKKPEDYLFVKNKGTNSTVYFRNTLTGTFYNTYVIEKYGKVGISEFSIPIVSDNAVKEQIYKNETVEKFSHGVHVTFISELKDILSKRKDKEIVIEKKEKGENEFVTAIKERKKTLKNVTPPSPKKHF